VSYWLARPSAYSFMAALKKRRTASGAIRDVADPGPWSYSYSNASRTPPAQLTGSGAVRLGITSTGQLVAP
jgi:hypothetical protein